MTTKPDMGKQTDPKTNEDVKDAPQTPAKGKNNKVTEDVKDGEKINIKPEDRKSFDEQDSDGSANAFDGK